MARLLIVTAVEAERAAALAAWDAAVGELAGRSVHRCQTPAGLVDVVCGGVGPVAAALSAAALLATPSARYDLVLSAGIGGGFPAAPLGSVVVADRVIAADLGAETADGGFSSLAELGFGAVDFPVDAAVAAELAGRAAAVVGPVLTVSTVTGSQARADRLLASYPGALAEGMEGAGVAQAAAQAGVRFAELRTISNPVGPRDRASWQLEPALAALARAVRAVLAEPSTLIGAHR